MAGEVQQFLADGGWKSRKLWLSIVCLGLLAGFVGLACHWAKIAGLYDEFTTGVLGVLSIYVGGNAAGRWATAKHVGSKVAEGAQKDAGGE